MAFSSVLFKPFLPDACQVNPQVYGAELAYWLARQLALKGVATSYPNCEDWGWFLEYITNAGDEYWLCCSNVCGEDGRWLCYLNPKAKKWFGLGKAKVENAQPLLVALKAVLVESAEISDIVWSQEQYTK